MASNVSFPPPPAQQSGGKSGITTTIFSRRKPSSDPPAYSQHDMLASKYRRYGKYIYYLRAILAFISLIGGIVILGCAADSLRLFSHTHLDSFYQLSVWPSNLDLRPTRAVLACGVVLTLFSLVYLGACLAPIPGTKTHTLNIISTPLSFLALFLTLFTTIYAYSINNRLSGSTTEGTLESWTCKWRGYEAPTNFKKICTKSQVSVDFVVLLLVVEAFSVITTALGWWVGSKQKRESLASRKGEIEMVA